MSYLDEMAAVPRDDVEPIDLDNLGDEAAPEQPAAHAPRARQVDWWQAWETARSVTLPALFTLIGLFLLIHAFI